MSLLFCKFWHYSNEIYNSFSFRGLEKMHVVNLTAELLKFKP